MEKYLKNLESLGLSENESRVYLALLESNNSQISEISIKSRVKRTTVYGVIDSLQKKGLVSKELKGIKETYQAEPPERLSKLIAEKKNLLEEILPGLVNLSKNKEAGGLIKVYEGLDSLKLLYLEMIEFVKTGDDYYVFCDFDSWILQDPAFFKSFTKQRGKLNIKVKHILIDSKLARLRGTKERQGNEEFKFLPNTVKISTNLIITPQRVLVQHISPKATALIIENLAIIKTNQAMFRVMWAAL